MRSWQADFDEEDRVTLQLKNVHSASFASNYLSEYSLWFTPSMFKLINNSNIFNLHVTLTVNSQ